MVPLIFLRSSPNVPCNQCPTVKNANDSEIESNSGNEISYCPVYTVSSKYSGTT